MSKVIRCEKCSRAFLKTEIGFSGRTYLGCSRDDVEVKKNDGCTLGKPGKPMIAVDNYTKVYLNDHEAVNGKEIYEQMLYL